MNQHQEVVGVEGGRRKNAPSETTRYFGLITARIDVQGRKILLTRGKVGKRDLSDGTLDRCLRWAYERLLIEYRDYEILERL